MYSVTVRVTQDDIDSGDHCPGSCPVALATDRATGLMTTVSVLEMRVEKMGEDGLLRQEDLALPLAAIDFVKAYDLGLPVRPISFTLEFPS